METPTQKSQRQAKRQEWLDDFKVTPPAHLSKRSKGLWRKVNPDLIRSDEKLVILQSALEALDRTDAAREQIAKEGMTTTTARSGVCHVHPLVKIERESRAAFANLWVQCGCGSFEYDVPTELLG